MRVSHEVTKARRVGLCFDAGFLHRALIAADTMEIRHKRAVVDLVIRHSRFVIPSAVVAAFNPDQLRDAHGRWEAVESAPTVPLNAWEKASLDDTLARLETRKAASAALYHRHGMQPPATPKEMDAVPQPVKDDWRKLTGEHSPPDPPHIIDLMLRDVRHVRASDDAVLHLQFAETRHALNAESLPLTKAERDLWKADAGTREKLRGIAWKRLSQRRVDLAKAGAIEPLKTAEGSPWPFPIVAGARSQKRASLAAQHYAGRQPAIDRLHSALARQLHYARSETLRNLEHSGRGVPPLSHTISGGDAAATLSPILAGGGVAADIVFDRETFGSQLLATIRNESADTLHEAGSQLFDEVGFDDPFSMPEPRAIRFLDRRANLLKDIPDEIHAEIMQEFREGLTDGDSMKQLAQRISGKFTEIEEGRGMTIASTETAAAYGYSRQEAMEQAGIEFKGWLTSHLPTVRQAHADAEADPRNERVPIDQPFKVGGEDLMYPGDEAGSPENVINCHCVALSLPGEPVQSGDWNEALHPRGAHGHFAFSPNQGEGAGASPIDPLAAQIEKGRKAMAHVIEHRSDVMNAMDRPGVGPVDFIWGNRGGGICHIIEKRDREGIQSAKLRGQSGKEVAMMMPEVIARGKLSPPYADANGPKRAIEWNGYKAVLSLRRNGERRAWLLTGFIRT